MIKTRIFSYVPFHLCRRHGFAKVAYSLAALVLLVLFTDPSQSFASGNQPEVSVSGGAYVIEGDPGGAAVNAVFTFSSNINPVGGSMPVRYTVSDVIGSDFLASGQEGTKNSSLLFSSNGRGQYSATVIIPITADNTDESDGYIKVVLNPAANSSSYAVASTVGADTATVAVVDDDVPELSISGGSSVTEGNPGGSAVNATFTVTSDIQPRSGMRVRYTVSDAAGSDFLTRGEEGLKNSSLIFSSNGSGQYTATISIPITADNIYETDGSVKVVLPSPTGGQVGSYTVDSTVGADTATVSVMDNDDGIPELSVSGGSSVTEVDPGGSAVNAVFTVTSDILPASALSVGYTVSEPSGSNFLVRSVEGTKTRSLSFANNGSGQHTATISIPINPDNIDEANSSVKVVLSAPTGSQVGSYTVASTVGADTATVAVVDDDVPVLSVSGGSSVTEGDPGDATVNAVFTFSSDIRSRIRIPVRYTVSDATGSDFLASGEEGSQTASFRFSGRSGQYTSEISIPITADNVDEADGSVKVVLNLPASSNSGSYTVSSTVGADTATVSVVDDDAPVLSVSGGSSVVALSGFFDANASTGSVSTTPEIYITSPQSELSVGDNYHVYIMTSSEYTGPLSVKKKITYYYTDETTISYTSTPTYDVSNNIVNYEQGSPSNNVSSVRIEILQSTGYSISPHQKSVVVDVKNTPSAGPDETPKLSVNRLVDAIGLGGQACFVFTFSPRPTNIVIFKYHLKRTSENNMVLYSRNFTDYVLSGRSNTTYCHTSSDEGTVVMSLKTGSGYTVDPDAGTASIEISDAEPEMSIEAVSNDITEGENARFRINTSRNVSQSFTVSLAVTEVGDFLGAGVNPTSVKVDTSWSSRFSAAQIINLPTVDDDIRESNGTITVTLSDGTGYSLSSEQGSGSAAVTVEDNEPPLPELEISGLRTVSNSQETPLAPDTPVTEGTTIGITINTVGNTQVASAVNAVIEVSQAGSFIENEVQPVVDPSPTKTINSGEFSVAHLIVTDDDDDGEVDGSITVRLVDSSNYRISGGAQVITVVVEDNDFPLVEIQGLEEASSPVTYDPVTRNPLSIREATQKIRFTVGTENGVAASTDLDVKIRVSITQYDVSVAETPATSVTTHTAIIPSQGNMDTFEIEPPIADIWLDTIHNFDSAGNNRHAVVVAEIQPNPLGNYNVSRDSTKSSKTVTVDDDDEVPTFRSAVRQGSGALTEGDTISAEFAIHTGLGINSNTGLFPAHKSTKEIPLTLSVKRNGVEEAQITGTFEALRESDVVEFRLPDNDFDDPDEDTLTFELVAPADNSPDYRLHNTVSFTAPVQDNDGELLISVTAHRYDFNAPKGSRIGEEIRWVDEDTPFAIKITASRNVDPSRTIAFSIPDSTHFIHLDDYGQTISTFPTSVTLSRAAIGNPFEPLIFKSALTDNTEVDAEFALNLTDGTTYDLDQSAKGVTVNVIDRGWPAVSAIAALLTEGAEGDGTVDFNIVPDLLSERIAVNLEVEDTGDMVNWDEEVVFGGLNHHIRQNDSENSAPETPQESTISRTNRQFTIHLYADTSQDPVKTRSNRIVKIPLLDDLVEEGQSTISVTVLQGKGYRVVDDSSANSRTILDNDSGVHQVSIESTSTTIHEREFATFKIWTSLDPESVDYPIPSIKLQLSETGEFIDDSRTDQSGALVFRNPFSTETYFSQLPENKYDLAIPKNLWREDTTSSKYYYEVRLRTQTDTVFEHDGSVTITIVPLADGAANEYGIVEEAGSATVSVLDWVDQGFSFIVLDDDVSSDESIQIQFRSDISPSETVTATLLYLFGLEALKTEEFSLEQGKKRWLREVEIPARVKEVGTASNIFVITLNAIAPNKYRKVSSTTCTKTCQGITVTPAPDSPVSERSQSYGYFIPVLSLSTIEDSIEEGNFARFRITADNPVAYELIVGVDVSETGNFIDGTTTTSVILRHLGTEVILNIATVDDSMDEENGSINARILPRAGYSVANPPKNNASVLVMDNDLARRDMNSQAVRAYAPVVIASMIESAIEASEFRMSLEGETHRQSRLMLNGRSDFPELLESAGQILNNEGRNPFELLDESSFSLVLSPDSGSDASMMMWGVGDVQNVSRSIDDVNGFNGSVFTGHMGFDAQFAQGGTFGLSASYTDARMKFQSISDDGLYGANMIGLHHHLGWMSADRETKLWANAGYSTGEIAITRDEYDLSVADSSMGMVAVGVGRELYSGAEFGDDARNELRFDAVAWGASQSIAGNDDFADMTLLSQRIRGVFTASHQSRLASDALIRPVAFTGIRWNGGVDETGALLITGIGIGYVGPHALSAEASSSLMFPGSENVREVGANASIRLDIGQDGLGVISEIQSEWGSNLNSADRLDGDFTLTDNGFVSTESKFDAEVGYGMRVLDRTAILNPFAGLTMDSTGQDIRFGAMLELAEHGSFEIRGHRGQNYGLLNHKAEIRSSVKW